MSQIKSHVPTKIWPLAEEQLGYYLAGLIDSNGYMLAEKTQIIIFSRSPNTRFLYKLRTALGFGKVNKNNLIISNQKGIIRTMLLIRGKLRNHSRIMEFNTFSRLYDSQSMPLYCRAVNWETPWFAGYWETRGKLRIRSSGLRGDSPVLSASMVISDYAILEQIKREFGGTIKGSSNLLNQRLDSYTWTLSGSAISKLLGYFDRYNLQSDVSYLNYILLRKAYLFSSEKGEHITMKGHMKLKKYEKTCDKI